MKRPTRPRPPRVVEPATVRASETSNDKALLEEILAERDDALRESAALREQLERMESIAVAEARRTAAQVAELKDEIRNLREQRAASEAFRKNLEEDFEKRIRAMEIELADSQERAKRVLKVSEEADRPDPKPGKDPAYG